MRDNGAVSLFSAHNQPSSESDFCGGELCMQRGCTDRRPRPAGQTQPERERERRVRAYKQNQSLSVSPRRKSPARCFLILILLLIIPFTWRTQRTILSFCGSGWAGEPQPDQAESECEREREAFNMINTLKFYLKLFLKVIRTRIFGAPTF